MTEPEKNAFPEDPSPEDPAGSTQPRQRMRKLLSGADENEAAITGQSKPRKTGELNPQDARPADTAHPADAPASSGTDTIPGAEAAAQQSADQPSAGPDAAQTQPVDSFNPSASDASTRAIPSVPPPISHIGDSQRHPTGAPESTAGWYGSAPTGPAPEDAATRPYSPSDTQPAQPGQVRPAPGQSGPNLGPSAPLPPYAPPPAGGESGQLPRRVEEVDPNATQVTPAAYSQRANRPNTGGLGRSSSYDQTRAVPSSQNRPVPPGGAYPPAGGYTPPPPPPTYSRSVGVAPRYAPRAGYTGAQQVKRKTGWRHNLGCALRAIIALLFMVVFVIVAAGSWLVFQYFAIARELPPVDQLRTNAAKFETTRILDRNGNLLYEILDPSAGRRTFVPLDKISPNLIAATLATEDREYYNHPGFDPFAIARAFWQNYTGGGVVSGASTITQQLARLLLLSPSERNEITYERKAREIVLAAEITRRYTKDEILELYLNEINYGNLAYGIEAAAETYFGTSADKLTMGQAAFLAGLPQAPAVYDIYTNREGALRRDKQVVLLMLQDSQEKGCIPVKARTTETTVCVDNTTALQAIQEIETYNFQMAQNNMRYPHWVNFIRSLLEAQYDPQTIYRSGFNVYTTLDPDLQDQAQAMVSQQVDALTDRNAHNGALVALKPNTGEILAMVGSPNFNDESNGGQINMAVSPRQPGSSIKPLTYVAAFEKGWTPSTLIWDVPTDFPPSGDPNDTREPYQPVNYDGRFHGPVTARTALANSYNIPAVKALQFVGIYGDSGLISFAKRLGINTLTSDQYGLALTLGGGEVTLLDMTSAFGTFANSGKRIPPVAISKITDYQGNVVYEYKPPAGEQVIRPEHAFLISSILSDNEARTPAFGANSVLHLPFPAAAKTGTTNDFRDNWTVGYTPDLAVGVWIGNADYTPMTNVTGLTGAAPAWSNFMQYAVPKITNGNPTLFPRPQGIVEKVICAVSGAEPSDNCPSQRSEYFASDQMPKKKEDDLWKKVRVDTWTGLTASAECSDFAEEKLVLNVDDSFARKWIKDNGDGQAWAQSLGFDQPVTFVPERECKASDPRPQIIFAGLSDKQTITASPFDIYAVVTATQNFRDFLLEWGQGDDPTDWHPLVENIGNQYANPEKIYTWDLKDIPAGNITLRIHLNSTDDSLYAEKKIHLTLNVPTPTPTATPTITVTPSPTNTLVPSVTPTITHTPVPPTATTAAPPSVTPGTTP